MYIYIYIYIYMHTCIELPARGDLLPRCAPAGDPKDGKTRNIHIIV